METDTPAVPDKFGKLMLFLQMIDPLWSDENAADEEECKQIVKKVCIDVRVKDYHIADNWEEKFKRFAEYFLDYSLVDSLVKCNKWLTLHKLLSIQLQTEEFAHIQRGVIKKAMQTVDQLMQIKRLHEENDTKIKEWQLNNLENAKQVLAYCHDDQVNEVLNFLLSKHLWAEIDSVFCIKQFIDENTKRFIVDVAMKETKQNYVYTKEREWDDKIYLLRYCVDDQVPVVVSHLTYLKCWTTVNRVIKEHGKYISESLLEWVVQQACSVAEDGQAAANVLPLALDHQLDSVIDSLLTWRHWSVLQTLLKERNLSASQKRRIVHEAIQQVADESTSLVFPFCTEEDQLRSLLEQLVSEKRWTVVFNMLIQGYASDKVLSWLVENTNEETIKLAIDPQPYSTFKVRFIHNGEVMGKNVSDIANCLVEKGWWQAVKVLLNYHKHNLTTDQVNWILREAVDRSDKTNCPIIYLLEFVPEEKLSDILVYLASLGKWCDVCNELSRRSELRNKFSDLKDWAVSEFFKSVQSPDNSFNRYEITMRFKMLLKWIKPADMESWFPTFVSHGLWSCVDVALQRGISEELKQMALDKLVKEDLLKIRDWFYAIEVLRKYSSDDTLKEALEHCVALKKWHIVESILDQKVPDSVREWAVKNLDQDTLRRCTIFTFNKSTDAIESFISQAMMGTDMNVEELRESTNIAWDKHLCYLVYLSLKRLTNDGKKPLPVVKMPTSLKTHLSLGTINRSRLESPCFETVVTEILNVLADTVNTRTVSKTKTLVSYEQLYRWTKQLECMDTHAISEGEVLQEILTVYNHVRNGQSDQMLYHILAMLPMLPTVQEIALKYLLEKRRWKVISHACLTRMPEMLRRTLFKAAVQQGQWAVVKQWADHFLYDDQRGWAMEEACRHRQWAVYLRLADHSLLEHEIMYALYKIINNINSDDESEWNVILDALERCADIQELRQLLKPEEMMLQQDLETMERRQRTGVRLQAMQKCLFKESKHFVLALKLNKLAAVVYRLYRRKKTSRTKLLSKIITQVIKKKAWHVVSRLLKLGTTQLYRDQLFARMTDIRQWPVCRTLLELGVSKEAIETSIPSLMLSSQWILLARVLEYDSTTDEKRKEIIFHAVKRGEGFLVWHGLQMLQNGLTESERKELFSLAIKNNALQALRLLVTESDSLGIRHRDEVLLKAIDYNQWDVVDSCLRHGGNINMSNKWMESPLLEKAFSRDWRAVEQLASRGADVTCADGSSTTALHFAVSYKQWVIARLLIQYHSKLKHCTKFGRTPLRGIIDERQISIVDCALLWSHDFQTDKNQVLETPLHAACAAGWRHVLRHLVARGCDPLAVTKAGNSVLACAVDLGEKKTVGEKKSKRKQYRERYRKVKVEQIQDESQVRLAKEKAQSRAQQMLAQCIKLGFTSRRSLGGDKQLLACSVHCL